MRAKGVCEIGNGESNAYHIGGFASYGFESPVL